MKQTTIDTLRERAEELTIFEDDEEEEFKKLRKEASEDYFIKGKLYFKCYVKLKQNLSKFKQQEENKEDQEFKEFKEYFEKIIIDEDFEDDLEYCNSKRYGYSNRKSLIRDHVKEKRKDISKFIELFFEISNQDIL